MNIDLSKRIQAAIAEALGLSDLSLDENGQAVIVIEGAYLHLQVIEEDEAQVLVLVADLGEVASSARFGVHQAMLIGNLSWRDVAGGALALDPDGERVLLVVRLDMATLDDAMLTQRLYATIDAAETWAAQLSTLQRQIAQENSVVSASAGLMPAPSDYV